jgi:hypothetical protein
MASRCGRPSSSRCSDQSPRQADDVGDRMGQHRRHAGRRTIRGAMILAIAAVTALMALGVIAARVVLGHYPALRSAAAVR